MAINTPNPINWDLDNGGSGPLFVSGFGGVPVDYELPVDERFAHGIREWRQSPTVTAQELAMVAVMNRLTDTPNWFVDVFDDATVAQWREDLEQDRFILNPRLLKDKTWAWCVQELRDKAIYYEKHGHIRVLDTGSCVCKAESAELQSLSAVFRQAAGPLACQYGMRRERQEQRKLLKAGSRIQLTQLEPEDYEDGGPVEQDPFYGYPLRRDEDPSGDGHHTVNDAALAREGNQEVHQVNTNASSHNAPVFPVVENNVVDDLSAPESISDDVIPYSTDTDGGQSEDEGENFNDITNVNWEWNKSQADLQHQRKTFDIAGSADMVISLVDPLLYPLVYGRTLVLQQGGIVALENVLESYGAATQPAPRHNLPLGSEYVSQPSLWSRRYQSLPFEMAFVGDDGSSNSRNITNVKITSYINGLHPDDHNYMYRAIEQVLSRSVQLWNDCLIRGHRGLYDRAHLGQLGPVPARIVTYGVEWENELPEWAVLFRVPTEHRKRLYHEEEREKLQLVPEGSRRRKREEGYLRSRFTDVVGKEDRKLPPPDSDLWQRAREYLGQPEPEAAHFDPESSPLSEELSAIPDDWDVGDERTWDLLVRKAKKILSFKHPEPGTAFSYEEWKHDRHTSRPIVDKAVPNPSSSSRPVIIPVTPPHMHDPVALQDQFRDQGLQVIAEISSIELTPEMPAYAPDAAARVVASTARATEQFARAMASDKYVMLDRKPDMDGWRLPGLLNEHIVAVAVYAFDVDNVTEPRLAFRQNTSLDYSLYQVREYLQRPPAAYYDPETDGPAHLIGKASDAKTLAEVLGFAELQNIDLSDGPDYPYQHIGSVATTQGRLVAFPNVLEHRLDPFCLVDSTKPGRFRWLTLYLVDPHYRVCSTRNVPPQQHEWWAGTVGHDLSKAFGLARETLDHIMRDTGSWPMSMDEAEWHREQRVEEDRQCQKYRLRGVGVINAPLLSSQR